MNPLVGGLSRIHEANEVVKHRKTNMGMCFKPEAIFAYMKYMSGVDLSPVHGISYEFVQEHGVVEKTFFPSFCHVLAYFNSQ